MNSLLRTEQLELVPSSAMPDSIFLQSESCGEYTGERLAVRDRDRYETIVALLAEGLGVKRIAKLVRCSTHTVQAVRDREPDAIATLKQRMAAGARSVARLCIESIRDAILDGHDVSAKDLAIVFGVMTDKAELLSGSPTSIVASAQGPTAADLAAYMAGLQTGSGGRETRQKAPGPVIDVTDEVQVQPTAQDAQEGAQDAPALPAIPRGSRGYKPGAAAADNSVSAPGLERLACGTTYPTSEESIGPARRRDDGDTTTYNGGNHGQHED